MKSESTTRETGEHPDEFGYTRLVGLMGKPKGPWPSAAIYNATFRALALDWRYMPLPLPNGHLRKALHRLQALGFSGAELAGPFQHEALDCVEELSPAAKKLDNCPMQELSR